MIGFKAGQCGIALGQFRIAFGQCRFKVGHAPCRRQAVIPNRESFHACVYITLLAFAA